MNLSIPVIIILFLYLALSSAVCRRAAETGKCGRLKSALTPLLMALYLCAAAGEAKPDIILRICLIFALAFGCAGDTLLEISEEGKYLVFGLSSFLIGHLFYIAASLSGISRSHLHPILFSGLIPYAVLFVAVVRKILPSVQKEMKTAVIVYMTVIILMSISMLLRFGSVSFSSASVCLAGSALFILSDILLALHVFKGKAFRGVMETYTSAQLLLTLGFLL